jgi:hypothetical protein
LSASFSIQHAIASTSRSSPRSAPRQTLPGLSNRADWPPAGRLTF